jgi:hypothetical protein
VRIKCLTEEIFKLGWHLKIDHKKENVFYDIEVGTSVCYFILVFLL